MKVFYFGCIGQTGHFLHGANQYPGIPDRHLFASVLDGLGFFVKALPQGQMIHYKIGPWSMLHFKDNTVDTRPGSHSIFLTDAPCTPEELLEASKVEWSQVVKRMGDRLHFKPTPASGDEPTPSTDSEGE